MTKRGLELIQGTLEFLILETFADGDPKHGFGVLRWITDATDGALSIEEGALYPALHRMERRGWLESEWGLSERNRKAKYYRITASGRKQLRKEEAGWREYVEAVAKVMAQAAAEA
jgi:PadR family transcriptional regulator PadR